MRAATGGLRPVIEGMNTGFLLLAYNQISNNCGMLHCTSGGQFTIPVIIRGPGGVGRQLGTEHSQHLVACSTPYNAKGLMKAAIRSENPVVLFEHVLYNLKGRIPDEEYVSSPEEAEMVRPGEHVTILTYSRMRHHRELHQEDPQGAHCPWRSAIIDNFWDYLDAPVLCLSSQDVPTPYAGTLGEWTAVQPPQILAAVEQLCQ